MAVTAKSPIIGFAATIGSGKTLLASTLLSTYQFRVISFAAPIKECLRAMGLTDDEIHGHGKELPHAMLGGRSPRFAMQSLGTEWGRNLIGPDIWVEIWRRKVTALPVNTPIVCDDVRFQNEADVIRTLGGIIVRIQRDDVTPTSNHSSEAQDFPADVTLTNNGTTRQFMEKAKALADAVMHGMPIPDDGDFSALSLAAE